jgi:catechol 2,3-dioxygenase-like lactoylglutathione lyase family enzyme
MENSAPLAAYPIIAFVTIVDVERAKSFYRDTLGLTLLNEEPPFALVFNANGVMVRLGMAKKLPEAHGTVLGWQVSKIEVAVEKLEAAGVRFERFDGLTQDEKGIWVSPTGAKVGWFRDLDGNILSISEHPEFEIPARSISDGH